MSIVTRFAPSPTGFLHIGGTRTALFNWLFAKNMGGKFLLRIEDTDRERSTQEAVNAIFSGLRWLGLDWDGEAVFQFSRAPKHREVVNELLENGNAYYCYCSQEELAAMRDQAKAAGLAPRYNGYWRDRDSKQAPAGVKPVVRLKAPTEGKTVLEDLVQGTVVTCNTQLDDMILLRSDGTPTYMLSVVVDDHDMNVTHVIRGDDHLTNTFRQIQIYQALGWQIPKFGHIPLIHGPDGAKMSKRHGAVGVEAYKALGILPQTLCNYLLRLGWAHGDDEIIPTEKAVEWFNIEGIGRSPSRFDMNKLLNLNSHYLRQAENDKLIDSIAEFLPNNLSAKLSDSADYRQRLVIGINGLKQRAKTLAELATGAQFYLLDAPLPMNDKIKLLLSERESREILKKLTEALKVFNEWNEASLHILVKDFSNGLGIGLGNVAKVARAALTGSEISPSIFEIMQALGKQETLNRLKRCGQLVF
ncbi:MAG: glutamate--tRNA ligase [Holosporales bacterium]|jgi:glutamyl-tRNA synthetase|nr:glutamate--tRNA ligase [Holosporales bacterium]